MAFDQNQPFDLLDAPDAKTDAGFDPSQPFEWVNEPPPKPIALGDGSVLNLDATPKSPQDEQVALNQATQQVKATLPPPGPPPPIDYSQHPVMAFAKGVGQVGKGIYGALADIGTGESTLQGGSGENVKAAIAGEKQPWQVRAEMPGVPPALALAQKTLAGAVEMAPKMAMLTAAQAVGVPSPVAAGAIFGFDDEGNFSPKQAAIAGALPFIGKWGGAISEGVAGKLGVTSDVAKGLVNAGGGYASANAFLAAQALPGWSKMTDAQKQDAVAGILANGLLGLADLHGLKTETGKVNLDQASEVFRHAAEKAQQGIAPIEARISGKVPRGASETATIPTTKESEVQNATQKGQVEGGIPAERGGNDTRGTSAEAGGSGGVPAAGGEAATPGASPASVRPPDAESVLTPAVRHEGKVYEAQTGQKNHGAIKLAQAKQGVDIMEGEHGFVQNGKFLTRAEAAKVFEDQTGNKPAKPGELHSEDLDQAGLLKHLEPQVSLQQRLEAPDTFKGKNWTKDALQYGAGLDPAKPEQLAELKQLEADYAAKLKAIPKKLENFDQISKIGNQKQWVTEAIQGAEGVSDRDVAKETLGKDYKPPFPKGKEAIPGEKEKGQKEGVLTGKEPSATVPTAPGQTTATETPPEDVNEPKSASTVRPPAASDIPHSPLSHVEGEIGTIKLKSQHKGTSQDAYTQAYAELQKKRPELFSPTGSAPDQVVQSLNDAGFKGVTTDNLFDTLLGNHTEQVKIRSGDTPEGRADKFQKALAANDKKPSKQVVSVGDLSVGSEFSVGSEKFKVISIDPDTGEVTAKDGRKFAAQTIPDGEDIPADKGSVKHPETITDFVPPEKVTGPKLGTGEKQGDLISSTQKEDFALAGEKGTDVERAQAAKEKAARDAAEAKALQAKQQQTLIPAGPGAATRPDLVPGGPDLPVNPGSPDIYGVAERVRDQRAAAGQVAPVEPGKGISAPDSVDRGRQLLQSGADPEKIMSDFEKTKKLSADDMAVARAHGEKLFQDARRIESAKGTDSPEWRAAFDAGSKWDERSKAMQTEWHKTGQAQQGETDLDTGSFTGLARSFKDSTGKDFTPSQAKQAKEIAKNVTATSAAADTAKQKLFGELDKQAKTATPASEAQKKVWNAVKAYIDQGVDNFDDIRNKVATDLGMKVDEVTKLMAQNRTVKRLADDVWNKQQMARRVKDQAKRWLTDQATPGFLRALQKIPRALFRSNVGFHGTVALGTHAPMLAYQPTFWKTYAENFGKMYQMVGTPGPGGQRAATAYYERQVQDLLRRPNYITARRAGLINDPYTAEDYTSPDTAKWIGRITGMGNRGYSVLKILRQDLFDHHWNKLPKTEQLPSVAAAIADAANHVTGVVQGKAPKGSNLVLFAPRLEASRVMWLVGDTLRAGRAAVDWKNAGPGEKWFAKNYAKERAWVGGTMFGMLAVNAGLLAAVGSKQKVNFTDPNKSDFLKFKIAGMDLSYGNAMLAMARLPVRENALRQKGGSGKTAKLIYPDESMSSEAFKYARSQMSPFAGVIADLNFKGDYENRPLPKMSLSGAQLPMPKRLAAQGVKPYTWTELTLDKVLPIPFKEPFEEVWKKGLGMSNDQLKSYGKSFAKAMFMAGTGSRLSEDYNAKGGTMHYHEP